MNLAGVFRTPAGGLRAPWRLLVFVAAAVLALLVAQGLVYPLLRTAAGVAEAPLLAESTLLVLGLAVAHAVALRVVDRRPWDDAGLGAARARELVEGTLVGAAAIALPALLLMGAGWLRPERAPDGSSAAFAVRMLLMLAPAALWEELLFRGYPLTVLRDAMGAAPALLFTSLAFGLVHLQNPGAEWRAILVVILAGLFLGGVRLATGSLWAAWLAHLAWNWTLAGLFHVPVSGLAVGPTDYRLVDAGPDWATGGAWGPEGGAFAALGLAGGLLYLRSRAAVHARIDTRI